MVSIPRTRSATSLAPPHADASTAPNTLTNAPTGTDPVASKANSDLGGPGHFAVGPSTVEIGRITTGDSQVFKESAKRLRMYAEARSPRKKRQTVRSMNTVSTESSSGPVPGPVPRPADPSRPLHHPRAFSTQPQTGTDVRDPRSAPSSAESSPSLPPQGIRRRYEQQAQNITSFASLHNPRPSALPEKTPLGPTARSSIIDNRPRLFPLGPSGHSGNALSSDYLDTNPATSADVSETSQAKLDTLVERMIAYARSKEGGSRIPGAHKAHSVTESPHPAAASLPHRQLLSTEEPRQATAPQPGDQRSRTDSETPTVGQQASASNLEHPFITQMANAPRNKNASRDSRPSLSQTRQPPIARSEPARMASSFSNRVQPDVRKLAPSPEMADIAGSDAPPGSGFRIHRDLLGLKYNSGLSKPSLHSRSLLQDPSNTEPIRSALHRTTGNSSGTLASSSIPEATSNIESQNVRLGLRTEPQLQSSRPASRPDAQSNYQPASRPDSQSNYQPASRPDAQSNHQPASRPDSQSNYQPASRPDAQSNYRPASRPDSQSNYRQDSQSHYRQDSQSNNRSRSDSREPRPEVRSESRPEARSEQRPSAPVQPVDAPQPPPATTRTPPEQSGKSGSDKEGERPQSNHAQRWNEVQWRAFSKSMHDSLVETGLAPAQAMRLFASMIRSLPEEMRNLSLFEVSRRLAVWQENAEKFKKR